MHNERTSNMRQRFCLITLTAFLSFSAATFGASNDGDHVFFYNQFGSPAFETINDWVVIGSPGYENYFSLNSDVDCVEDAVDVAGLNTRLDWTVPYTQTVPAGTWCGYEFTIPSGVKENIIRWYTAGRYNIGTGAEVRLIDEYDNIIWSYDDTGTWLDTYSDFFSPTEKVRLIVYQNTAGYLWAGQYFYAQLMQMTTQDIPEYFGYYFVNSARGDFFENVNYDISGFTNLNHVMLNSMSVAEVAALAGRYAAKGCKMMVDTRWQFFDGNGDLLPLATRQAQWALLWSKIQPVIDSVGGLYLIDEPVINGASTADLYTAISEIKNDYSGPLLAVYSYVTVEQLGWGVIPTNIDWVGVNKFSCDFADIESLVATLEEFLPAWQKIFLVPQATTYQPCSYIASQELECYDWQVHNWSWEYWKLANENPKIVGLMCHVLEDMIGCDMTLSQEAQSAIGTKVK